MLESKITEIVQKHYKKSVLASPSESVPIISDAIKEALAAEKENSPNVSSVYEEPEHDAMLGYLKPLVKHLEENKLNYFIVAGKDGTCARYMNGNGDDISGMISGLVKKNPSAKIVIESSLG